MNPSHTLIYDKQCVAGRQTPASVMWWCVCLLRLPCSPPCSFLYILHYTTGKTNKANNFKGYFLHTCDRIFAHYLLYSLHPAESLSPSMFCHLCSAFSALFRNTRRSYLYTLLQPLIGVQGYLLSLCFFSRSMTV